MIEWIKIEDGCELPNCAQEVIVLSESSVLGNKCKTLYLAMIVEDGYWIETTDRQEIGYVKYWARVDLPDGN